MGKGCRGGVFLVLDDLSNDLTSMYGYLGIG
jgi:hypothetical protein